ncbi:MULTISPECIES: hypothetical protein [unclassified Moorena]|uniref:hypothetical protein n=1 Tax=unclassified Moorena TaxID=2683338 RepID=UPI0014010D16|nr:MULTISPECIES: hypothetical protein [unclassified Moorena]NEO16615.1 hypothetical protein [Moorena sp. SIO3E8]NEQ03299.1 hypothetical protein [Moorena sp. SIO3F7]
MQSLMGETPKTALHRFPRSDQGKRGKLSGHRGGFFRFRSGVGSRKAHRGSRENYSVIIVYLDTYLNRGVSVGRCLDAVAHGGNPRMKALHRLSAGWHNYSDASQ